ncbi:ubiquinol-cytochrome c reductase iron-sulfur subunit [Marinifilum caeruleilacunae]|uniref:Rieske (2Fe-2S) protein n=1 Tax=Marinifilum caeruleilacunae TaxID=2499076 RepID=A0ABX1WYU7_9BACT|nr:Rieske (2Fe-2S) protein [Marinifilum caeruleilacunae]NOU61323.1 Rieske (2Fe-2S) protein [Marinifilum caeruleilacunae]
MKVNRRKFIKRLLIVAASVEAIFLLKDGVSKVDTSSSKDLFNAGRVDSFEKNKLYPFSTGQFFLKRYEDGGFLALSVKCTHLGCIINTNSKSGGFNCPCHASQFNQFGEVLSAPATRPLDIFPITIENGEIWVDTKKPVKRSNFSKSQLSYA